MFKNLLDKILNKFLYKIYVFDKSKNSNYIIRCPKHRFNLIYKSIGLDDNIFLHNKYKPAIITPNGIKE